jgi:outer membrane protein insertion porin family
MRPSFRGFLCATALTVCLASPAFADNAVRDIKVVGTERIEAATVLSYLDLKKGDMASQEALDTALKGLFATGLFADVQISESGGVVTVQIAENPVINQVAFEGNDELKDEDLQAEIQARPRQVFTRTSVQNDVARLYELYRRKGRFSATVEPKIITLDQNRVNLVFEIAEGPETTISTIRFVGNKRFSDDELRGELSSAEHRWYNFLSTSDRYDPDRLSYDQELLRQFYLKEGYADFRILSAVSELSPDREKFFITVTVDEGDRYKVGDVRINSQIRDLDPNALTDQIGFSVDDWYNAEDVKTTLDHMTKKLGDMQYAFVSVVPDVQRSREKQTVDIVFNVNESPRVFVERINVNGNARTLDKVIRREMDLVEGDPFNRTKLAKSEQKVKDLGYFSKVDVKTLPGSAPDKTVVDIGVEEQSTGELSFGAGFSTNDGPLADFQIRERNLMGKGQDLALAATVAGKRTEFDVSFTEPYFMDRDLSAGIDAFHMTRDQQDVSSFDQRRTGGGARFGYPLAEHTRQVWKYRLEQNEITNVDSDASRYIIEQEGSRMTSAVSQRLTYDDLDSRQFPTDGVSSWLDTELAGLGGEAKYVSGKLGGSYYYPVSEGWVFNLMGELGVIESYSDENVQINERYFLGGNSFRGFEKSGLGPRDITTDDSLGGNRFYRATAELSFPIGLPEELGVAGHAFTDAGSVWQLDDDSLVGIVDDSSLRASAGLGLSWRSPMGPVRIDLAEPFLKEDYDKKQVFRFSFGTRF